MKHGSPVGYLTHKVLFIQKRGLYIYYLNERLKQKLQYK